MVIINNNKKGEKMAIKEPYINKFRAVPANRLEWAKLKTIKERYGNNVLRIPSNISYCLFR